MSDDDHNRIRVCMRVRPQITALSQRPYGAFYDSRGMGLPVKLARRTGAAAGFFVGECLL